MSQFGLLLYAIARFVLESIYLTRMIFHDRCEWQTYQNYSLIYEGWWWKTRDVHEFTPSVAHADACGRRRIRFSISYQRVLRTLSWLDYSRVVQVKWLVGLPAVVRITLCDDVPWGSRRPESSSVSAKWKTIVFHTLTSSISRFRQQNFKYI